MDASKIAQALMSGQGRDMLGSGMAGQGADTMQLKQIYDQQQIEAQMTGQPLPPFEQWVQMVMSQQAMGPQGM